jgi:drug/metabolite transporter (DMT)-like permease
MRTRLGGKLGVYAAFLAIWGIWGSTYLAIEVAIETIPPLLMIGIRCVVSGLVLYAFARYRGAPGARSEEWLQAGIAGALLFLGGQGVVAWAEQRVESGSAALLNATIPMFVILLGLRDSKVKRGRIEWPTRAVIAGLGLGLMGVALTVGVGAGGIDAFGASALLLASFSWAAGVYRAGGASERWPIRRAGMQLLAGGVGLGLVAAVTGETARFNAGSITSNSLLALGYLIVFGSLIAFSAFVWLLGRVDPARVASHAYVNPIVAVMLGVLIGGEILTPNRIMGGLLIVFAVALIVTGGKNGRARVEGRNEGHGSGRVHEAARGHGARGRAGDGGQSRSPDPAPCRG